MKQRSENPYFYFRHFESAQKKKYKTECCTGIAGANTLYALSSILKSHKCNHFTQEREMLAVEMVLFHVKYCNTIQAAEVTLSFLSHPQGPALLTAEAEAVCGMGLQWTDVLSI